MSSVFINFANTLANEFEALIYSYSNMNYVTFNGERLNKILQSLPFDDFCLKRKTTKLLELKTRHE